MLISIELCSKVRFLVETQEHIVNCRHMKGDKECIDVNIVNDSEADSSVLRELCTRFRYFEELRIERG